MAAAAGSQHRCVFVGNIPYDATEEQLIQICEEVGPVVSFRLVLDRETGKPKGYGFCEYKDEETALSARRNLQGYEINGRQLRVDFAENDKGSDRNREQGRGGPGLAPNIDAQKSIGGLPVGDPTFRQSVGISLAATAASVMAGALGGSQTTSFSSTQNGLQSTSGLGNDPLTHYLAKMSRYQLNEILSEIKSLAANHKALAQQLLQRYAQLPKALFQAQIMLGSVSPQMLQMVKPQQPSSSVRQPFFQNGMQVLKPPAPTYLGQTPQNPVAHQQSSLLSKTIPTLPRFHYQTPPHGQASMQETMSESSDFAKISLAQPQALGSLPNPLQASSLPGSKGPISQLHPPIVQHPKSALLAQQPRAVVSDTSLRQSIPCRLTSQAPDGVIIPNEAGTSTSVGHEKTWAPRTNILTSSGVSFREPSSMTNDKSEMMGRPSKLARLEHGKSAPHTMTSADTSTSNSFPGDGMQQPQIRTPQLLPEMESALLQQVMNLTPEQLSSLPEEQREQVLELQKVMHNQLAGVLR